MKKFTDFKKEYKRVFEQEISLEKPENTQQNQETIQQQNNQTTSNQQEAVGESGSEIIKLFSKFFETREMAHIYHLQVKGEEGSHAKHKALQKYYEGVIDIIDDIIEVYQGQYGVIDGYEIIDTKETTKKDVISYFEESVEFVKNARKSVKDEDTHTHSLIDDLVCLLYKTLYKLKFTK